MSEISSDLNKGLGIYNLISNPFHFKAADSIISSGDNQISSLNSGLLSVFYSLAADFGISQKKR